MQIKRIKTISSSTTGPQTYRRRDEHVCVHRHSQGERRRPRSRRPDQNVDSWRATTSRVIRTVAFPQKSIMCGELPPVDGPRRKESWVLRFTRNNQRVFDSFCVSDEASFDLSVFSQKKLISRITARRSSTNPHQCFRNASRKI